MIEKKKNDQSGCVPQSSNCIIWQGPDIPCINLCKGDSITDVTYKLATELCDVLNILDIEQYDFECLLDQKLCPEFQNIQDLINFIIEKLCAIETCCDGNTDEVNTLKNASQPILQIAACFQYVDQFGSVISQMQLDQYILAIGTKVCSMSNIINLLQDQVNNIDDRLSNLETTVSLLPPVPSYEIATSCLFPLLSDIPITTFVENTEAALCDLKTRLGSNAELLSAINENCVSDSDTMVSVNQPYSSLSEFVNDVDYTTVADAINNMWLVICDLRQAVIDLQDCCKATCSDIMISINQIQTVITPNNIRFRIDGVLPGGVTQCTPAMRIILEDACGFITEANLASYSLNTLESFLLNNFPSLNNTIGYNATFEMCFDIDGVTCYKSQTKYLDNDNNFNCPSLTWDAGPNAGQAEFTFTAPSTLASCPVTYLVQVFEENTNNLLAVGQVVSSGGLETGLITVGVPRPVTIEWQVTMIQNNFSRVCQKTGTYTIAI